MLRFRCWVCTEASSLGPAKPRKPSKPLLPCCTSAVVCSHRHANCVCSTTGPQTTLQALKQRHMPFPSRFLSWHTIPRHRWATQPAPTCEGITGNVQCQMLCPLHFKAIDFQTRAEVHSLAAEMGLPACWKNFIGPTLMQSMHQCCVKQASPCRTRWQLSWMLQSSW